MNDRRTRGRCDLPFPARIRLEGSQESMGSEGQTRDISARGVYLREAKKREEARILENFLERECWILPWREES